MQRPPLRFRLRPLLPILLFPLFVRAACAAHPLVTDDPNTQGRGGNQVEVNTDWQHVAAIDSETASLTYTYGRRDNLDLFASVPLGVRQPAGVGNVSLGAKWRFLERGGSRLALKPELLLPSGGEDKGLGSAGPGMALTLIGAQAIGRWQVYANLGMSANRYHAPAAIAANRSVLWHASLATAYAASRRLALVADIGAARNPDASSRIDPAYALLGVIYSPRPDLDLDVGVRAGLTRADVGRQAGVGITWRF